MVSAVTNAPTSPQELLRRSKSIRRSRRGRFFVLRLVLAIVITLIMFFPIYWMMVTAFSTREDLYAPGLHLWPLHFTFDNFRTPFAEFPIWTWFKNSAVITVLTTVITVLVKRLMVQRTHMAHKPTTTTMRRGWLRIPTG